MAARLPSVASRRPSIITNIHHTPQPSALLKPSHTPLSHTPSRAATIIRRPRRPYTFTQLVQQTDGSTYTHRTTSPLALYKSTKDTRNHILWQPSDSSLRNVEVDEAGKLAAFRDRFGRGWDAEGGAREEHPDAVDKSDRTAEAPSDADAAATADTAANKAPEKAPAHDSYDALSDLISSYSAKQEAEKEAKPQRKKK
ncbi:uncharacterized protein F4812DRAFT_446885 [Daldinia caldariorum]|uniref:uncharacterized protein n=1 Tax=Daldinia caldariorum TaxID=326644 RepID=UPI0020086267|nr:uncharacterized protein F4812DRAFT_446885 [Daldinia caldariorum]KAI1463422.1 hypothetical protein F4812DRAFT_446885 [Daldinia caldariorum]